MPNVIWNNVYITNNNDFIFNGYFSVNSENNITYFSNNNDKETNILQPLTYLPDSSGVVINGGGVDNLFVNNDFTNGGTNITNIPLLSALYPDAVAWQLLSNSRIRYLNTNDNHWYYVNNLEDYSVTISSNTESPFSNICFPAKTPIRTDIGLINIEEIDPNIHTIRNKKIVEITKTITRDKHLICFENDSLGHNMPSQKTIISKNHKVFYKGEMIKAKDFINKFENVYHIKYTGEILYNVLMEDYDKMVVNNLICETLDPENNIAKLQNVMQDFSIIDQIKIIKEYNKFIVKNNIFTPKK
jgi:hypothetical protein